MVRTDSEGFPSAHAAVESYLLTVSAGEPLVDFKRPILVYEEIGSKVGTLA